MKKYKIYVFCLCLGFSLFVSCKSDWPDEVPAAPDGTVKMKFQATLLEEREMTTRAVDPDGKAIRTFWLFCFDENNLFLGRSKAVGAEIDGETTTSGSFTADIPASTRVIHYLVNVNLDAFEDRNYLGTSESYVISPLVSTSGRLTYWSRGAYTPGDSPHVLLYRGQALVTAKSDISGFTFDGIAVCNRWLSGTVAPFNADETTEAGRFNWTLDDPFVSYHGAMQKAIDPADVKSGQMEEFIFEHKNTFEDPLFVIVKGTSASGGGTYYYKVQLVNAEKRFYTVYRNYRYTIKVTGDPGKGYSSFSAALNSPPYNNPLFSIDADLPSISSGESTLQLNLGTTFIIHEENVIHSGTYSYKIPYNYRTYESGSGWVYKSATDVDITQNDGFIQGVTWDQNFVTVTFKGAPAENMHIGKIAVWGGSLSRTVTIYYTKKFTFSPVFMTDRMANALSTDAVATLTFTVPESYPSALFPIDCKIAAPALNPMETLPVEQDESSGYHYVKRVEKPGVYSVAFKNISTPGAGQTREIKLSANNYNDATATFTYVATLNTLSAAPSSLAFAPKKGATGTFTVTSRNNESLSLYSRYARVTSPASTVTTVDAATGLKRYDFTATGTSTSVTVITEKPLSAEVMNITGATSRSATLAVANSPASYEFGLKINGSSSTAAVNYSPGTPVELTFNLPADAWMTADNEYYLYCRNLKATGAVSERLIPTASGFTYRPAASGNQTLTFVTTAVASAETITLLANAGDVIFQSASVDYTNPPVMGTVTYAGTGVPQGGFVSIERTDGLRIGSLEITAAGQYSLTFYPDYILTTKDEVIFTYTSTGDGSVYQTKTTIGGILSGSTNLTLVKI
ncbi:hypothetical protein [uncultured Proteiniphilum sp.]|uniref:hypothetical protein n=1 Tax=uncultured Proteiniphilum sp. TaxID=497637 RepID=UPI002625B515|nr:hypothetical protein [uncultured Proteiniphilum sp.]